MRPHEAVYWAESNMSIHGHHVRVGDPEAFLDDVIQSRWFKSRYPRVAANPPAMRVLPPSLSDRADWGGYMADTHTIKIPNWMKDALSILHELAHICTPVRPSKYISWREKAHGPEFCKTELALVKRFMGPEAHHCLYHSFKAANCI